MDNNWDFPPHTHGGKVDGSYAPPHGDGEAVQAASRERAKTVEKEYGTTVPWYDGKWSLPVKVETIKGGN